MSTQRVPPSGSPHQASAHVPPAIEPREHGRRFGIRDGLYQAVTQGWGEQYLSAFALFLTATPFQVSVLSAIPQLLGTCAQLISVKISHWFSNRTSQVFWGIVGQSLTWIPIMVLPLLWPDHGPWLLIGAVALSVSFTQFTSPAWNSLITDLLEPNERGLYFARRSRVIAMTSFVSLCLAGGLLSVFEQLQLLWVGFAIMFMIAGLSRSASALLLWQLRGVTQQELRASPMRFLDFLRDRTSRNFLRFLLFSGLMYAAVLVSGPFFVIYLLQDLHFTHWQYGTWLAAGIVGQFLTLRSWGEFGDRFGNKALLTVTSVLVAFLPMLYLLDASWSFVVVVNFGGGVVWAGLGLGLNNYVFDAVESTHRAQAIAISSLVTALGWAMGTMIGSVLIGIVPATIHLGSWSLAFISNLPLIFFLSGVLRLLVSVSLLRIFHEPRPLERYAHHQLLWELPLLKPLRQLSRRPTRIS